ncbi:unnamed protein product [Allacma fusca]|uniref:Uncharacterized protein n=1 Tax=Allacma fusca TaxID=39272 RepID=A0A8J2K0U7_9HEXA|nr:unnamed protein product [Allacma fusca]
MNGIQAKRQRSRVILETFFLEMLTRNALLCFREMILLYQTPSLPQLIWKSTILSDTTQISRKIKGI